MIKKILEESRVIAVVGLSDEPHRPSYRVARYMQQQGYRIIPVNPNFEEILGEKCYPNLEAIPEPVDVVNIFRLPRFVPPVVETAIKIKAKTVWMQEGIVHREAADRAEQAGLQVVMDLCILKEHRRLAQERAHAST